MKKAKYILIGGVILIFIAYILRFLWEPHSLSELFDANYMSITPEQGTSSFNCFNVQEYNGKKYFSDKGNLVLQKADSDKKEIQVKNVGSFLIRDDELVYTLSDETDKVYVKNLQTNKVKNISIKNADILLNDNEYVYIYSDGNILHKFDRLWNEVKTIDLNRKGFRKRFERACIIGGKLVFATEALKLYIYDEQEETLHKVKIPKGEEHSEDGDMLIMNNQVYTADTHFWGISYRINSVNVEYADS